MAGYIFGRNHGGEIGNQKIAMTAPVAQDGDAEQGWDVRFYAPPWTLPFLRRNEIAIPVDV